MKLGNYENYAINLLSKLKDSVIEEINQHIT